MSRSKDGLVWHRLLHMLACARTGHKSSHVKLDHSTPSRHNIWASSVKCEHVTAMLLLVSVRTRTRGWPGWSRQQQPPAYVWADLGVGWLSLATTPMGVHKSQM